MQLGDIVDSLGCSVCCGEEALTREVTGGFCGDLLSDVIAGASEGSVWITRQTHQNIVAVAALRDVVAIIIVDGNEVSPETVAKASAEGIPIVISPYKAFETAGKIYALLGMAK